MRSIAGMIRGRLLWFAAGVACTSIAVVSAQLLTRAGPEDRQWFLYIGENVSFIDSRGPALWRGAEIARDCGAGSFEMIPASAADAVDGTRIPLERRNNVALTCVIEKAQDAGLNVSLGLDTVNRETD